MKNIDKLFSSSKIAIFGWPATGKSMLSKILSEKLNLDVYALDLIRWKYINNGVKDDDMFLDEYNELLKKESWIIEGNALDFINSRLEQADLLIFFDSTVEQSINNFLQRDSRVKSGAEKRVNFDDAKSSSDTIKWIRERYSKKIISLKSKLNEYEDKLIIINNYDELDKFLSALD